ncbi:MULTISPECIES: NAD(P)/FAD-dependent oxidoreductase [Paenibacillus]|uniref:NAD(P)/FAD-dependent oxidoreductase n=1 Tax=Paenibacillus TaxID=44249 RepID=UPI002FE21167
MINGWDVGIIGGGPAGLSAALVLGRARRSAVVLDEGRPRNRVTREAHGFLTRDGIAPAEFRRIAAEQLRRYPSIQLVEERAEGISGADGQFEITSARGDVYRVKKLLFTTGKRDLPLEISGLQEVYGRSAFVCPYCDGWELSDKPLVLIASGDRAMHMAKMLTGWTDQTVLCTNGPSGWSAEERLELERHNIPVTEAPIRHIESSDGQVEQVLLEDGTRIPCEGIFFAPRLAAGSDLPGYIGCEMSDAGTVIVRDEFGKTSVPGVYSAGDAATEMHQAIWAASMGSAAAAGINLELITEAWNRLA